MVKESFPSERANKQTPRAIRQVSTGNSKTKRATITDAGTTLTIPDQAVGVILHNAGFAPIRIRINSSGGDYFTIGAGVILPKVAVNRSVLEALTAPGSSSILECIFEG